jgi:replicative DNA helicase Mcm
MEGAAVPITPRQLEAFVRMSEASARARLSPLVAAEDAERSVRIVEYWLQKVTGIEGRFDIDIVATGVSTSQREQIIILRDIIQELAGAEGTADLGDIVERAEQRGIPAAKVEQYLKRWQQEGEVYSPARNKYRLITRS